MIYWCDNLQKLYNCKVSRGLETIAAIFLLCKNAVYVIEGFCYDEKSLQIVKNSETFDVQSFSIFLKENNFFVLSGTENN